MFVVNATNTKTKKKGNIFYHNIPHIVSTLNIYIYSNNE